MVTVCNCSTTHKWTYCNSWNDLECQL